MTAPGHPIVGKLVRGLPQWARGRVLGFAAWKWLATVLLLFLTFAAMAACYATQAKLNARWRGRAWFLRLFPVIFPVAAALMPQLARVIAQDHLAIRATPLYYLQFVLGLLFVAATIVLVFAVSGKIAEAIIASPRIHPQGLDAQLIRIVGKLLSMVVAVIIFLLGGQQLGIHLTTLLASAGVGGLALALAAQDTLKNLFWNADVDDRQAVSRGRADCVRQLRTALWRTLACGPPSCDC